MLVTTIIIYSQFNNRTIFVHDHVVITNYLHILYTYILAVCSDNSNWRKDACSIVTRIILCLIDDCNYKLCKLRELCKLRMVTKSLCILYSVVRDQNRSVLFYVLTVATILFK